LTDLPWWRQAKVTRWDQAIGLALMVVTIFVLQPATLGTDLSWSDNWIAAGCWFLVVLVLIEIRRRLSRADREP
jgi:uncharacterized membrane protein